MVFVRKNLKILTIQFRIGVSLMVDTANQKVLAFYMLELFILLKMRGNQAAWTSSNWDNYDQSQAAWTSSNWSNYDQPLISTIKTLEFQRFTIIKTPKVAKT